MRLSCTIRGTRVPAQAPESRRGRSDRSTRERRTAPAAGSENGGPWARPGHAAASGSREASRQPAARQGLPSCKRKELDSDNLSEQGPRFSLRVSGKGAALDTWMLAADTHVRLMTYRQERACVKL